jgi:hypothetical protein
MLSFSGIAQIQEKVKGYTRKRSGWCQYRYHALCSRGPSVPYDGLSPFDIYPIYVEARDSDIPKFDALVPGIIVWIDKGNVITWSRKYQNERIWNVMLTAKIDDVKIIGRAKIELSYDEHLRLFSNAVRNNP